MATNPTEGNAVPLRSRFLSQFLLTAFGSAGGQAILLLATPVLTRLYTPAQYGVWALFISLGFANTVLAGLRYDVAVVLAKTRGGALSAFALCVTISILFSLVVLAASVAALPMLAELTIPKELLYSLFLLPVSLISTGAFQAGLLWYAREHQFGLTAINRIAQYMVMVAIQVGLPLLFAPSAYFLIFGTVAGQCVSGAMVIATMVRSDGKQLLQAFRLSRMKAVARRFRRQPLFTAPYTLGTQAFAQSIAAILAAAGGVAASGFYAVSFRIFYSPLALVSTSMGQVFFPRISRASDSRALETVSLQIVSCMAIVFGLLAGSFLAMGDDVVPMLFGAKWAAATPIMKIMIFPSIFLAMGSWIERIFDVFSKQHVSLAIEFGFDILALAGLLGGIYVLHNMLLGLMLLSAFMSLGYLAWLVAAFAVANFSWHRLIIRLALFFVMAVVGWVFAAQIKHLAPLPLALGIIAFALAATAIWQSASLLSRLNEWDVEYYRTQGRI